MVRLPLKSYSQNSSEKLRNGEEDVREDPVKAMEREREREWILFSARARVYASVPVENKRGGQKPRKQ